MIRPTQARRGSAARGFVLAVAVLALIGAVSAAVWWLRGPDEPLVALRAPLAPREEPHVAAYVPPSGEGYVGNEACSRCHIEIAESYKTHPMSRSITRVDDNAADASVSQAESRFSGERQVYDVEMRDGVMIHHERMFDGAGEQIYDEAQQVEWVVGAGQRAKAYLIQRSDLLFMSPLTWYSASSRWGMAPGYAPDDPRRFSRRVQDDCLACHAGRVEPVGHALNRFDNPAVHAAIGCENCHGPGEQHAALHETGESSGDQDDPIVNPARLDSDRRESVCYQCHLEAAARVLRPGRSHLDFRPGQRLDEIWTVFDESSDAEGERAPWCITCNRCVPAFATPPAKESLDASRAMTRIGSRRRRRKSRSIGRSASPVTMTARARPHVNCGTRVRTRASPAICPVGKRAMLLT